MIRQRLRSIEKKLSGGKEKVCVTFFGPKGMPEDDGESPPCPITNEPRALDKCNACTERTSAVVTFNDVEADERQD